jgi:hypothetical protein
MTLSTVGVGCVTKRVAVAAVLLAAGWAQAQTSPGYRYINFKGQTEPTAVPATLVSNDGSVTMNVAGAAATAAPMSSVNPACAQPSGPRASCRALTACSRWSCTSMAASIKNR